MEAGVLNRQTFQTSTEIERGTVQDLEMVDQQRSTEFDSPPIFSRSTTVITEQPQEENVQSRRTVPVDNLDWISSPRSQLSELAGSHFLANVEQLEIQQIVDLSTLLGRSEKRFQYRVKIPRAETVFLAMETKEYNQSSGWNCSRFFRGDFSLAILNQSGETAFIMRMSTAWTYTLNKLHKMTVGNSNLLGTVEQNCGLIGSSFTIYDEMRNELCNIYGPNVCGCCMYAEAQFQVITIDGTHQIASLMHQWDNANHDYTLLITFARDMDVKLKSLLLATAFLLEYMYFERMNKPMRPYLTDV